MKIIITIILILLMTTVSNATVVFSSKWASATTGGSGTENDGGNWYQAEPSGSDVSILRVSGSEVNIGGTGKGPSGPPNSSATYYLRITHHNTGDKQLYLQTASENSATEYTDLYMGAWWYFQTGFQFRASAKFMDFRGNLSKLAAGNGHLQLFGFYSGAGYAKDGTYANTGYTNGYNYFNNQIANLSDFRYMSSVSKNVSGNEDNWNFYDVSSNFDSNLNISDNVVGRSGYDPANVNRIFFTGGKWMAVIVHAKISTTDGELDMWVKDGSAALKKVMKWNRNTVWSSDNSTPHNFYTANGTAGINHCQFNSYWNNGSSYPSTQYMWLANPVVATTLDEVASFLGVSLVIDTRPSPPTGLRIQ